MAIYKLASQIRTSEKTRHSLPLTPISGERIMISISAICKSVSLLRPKNNSLISSEYILCIFSYLNLTLLLIKRLPGFFFFETPTVELNWNAFQPFKACFYQGCRYPLPTVCLARSRRWFRLTQSSYGSA